MKLLQRQKYFHAFALFLIARQKQAEVLSLQKDIWKVLDIDPENQGITHVDDCIYSPETLDVEQDFVSVISREGFLIESEEEEIKRLTKK